MSAQGIRPGLSSSNNGSVMKYIFFGSIILCGIVIILVTFHYTTFGIFSLSPTSGAIITIPIGISSTGSAYATSTIPVYLSTKFSAVKQINYTVSFDVYISSTLNSGNKYRVIFANGKQIRDPAVPVCVNGLPAGCDSNRGKYLTTDTLAAGNTTGITVDASSLQSIQNAVFGNNGNICMYLSPDTNDLNLMYYTAGSVSKSKGDVISWIAGTGSGGSTRVIKPECGSDGTYRVNDIEYECQSTSGNNWITKRGTMSTEPDLKIQNVPLQKPFRITLAVDSNFIEVYMNGDLVLTAKTPAGSELYTFPTDNASQINFTGPPMFSSNCKVGNVTYWGQVLPAKSIRYFSTKPAAATVFTQA